MDSVTAVCNGAATIITGFAAGKGAALGITLQNKATVNLTAGEEINCTIKDHPGKDTSLMKYCVQEVFEYTGLTAGAEVTAEPTMPLGVGLKSSSVAANAVTLATVEALSRREGVDWRKYPLNGAKVTDMDVINLGINAAFKAEVTSTGALDDASASYWGGYTVTDNLDRKIHKKDNLPNTMDVLIYLPEKIKEVSSGKVDVDYVKKYEKQVRYLWDRALEGDIYEALTFNGITHSIIFDYGLEPTKLALEAGARAAGLSGTGPAVVALTSDPDPVREAWNTLKGRVIECKTNNNKARILE